MKCEMRLHYYPGDPGESIRVDAPKCNGCGECARFCARRVWSKDGGVFRPATPRHCAECGACWNMCPTNRKIAPSFMGWNRTMQYKVKASMPDLLKLQKLDSI